MKMFCEIHKKLWCFRFCCTPNTKQVIKRASIQIINRNIKLITTFIENNFITIKSNTCTNFRDKFILLDLLVGKWKPHLSIWMYIMIIYRWDGKDGMFFFQLAFMWLKTRLRRFLLHSNQDVFLWVLCRNIFSFTFHQYHKC